MKFCAFPLFIKFSSVVGNILSKNGYNFIFVGGLVNGLKYSISNCWVSHHISRDFVIETTADSMRTGIFLEELNRNMVLFLSVDYLVCNGPCECAGACVGVRECECACVLDMGIM